MSKVKRAIIMAAGKGTRMRPLTYKTPKPLIKVNGTPMIESIIEALHKNGITEIYVVVGYLGEQFEYLESKYQGLALVLNPYYDLFNNISSMYVVREHLRDAIVLDGDQLISDPSILAPDFLKSGYAAIWTQEADHEWMLQLDHRQIIGCIRNQVLTGWRLYSISRWNESDGMKLQNLLEYEFEEAKHRDVYWDDVPIFLHPDQFNLTMTPIKAVDVQEIDSISQLTQIDATYSRIRSGEIKHA